MILSAKERTETTGKKYHSFIVSNNGTHIFFGLKNIYNYELTGRLFKCPTI
jgi:hypothetical protein